MLNQWIQSSVRTASILILCFAVVADAGPIGDFKNESLDINESFLGRFKRESDKSLASNFPDPNRTLTGTNLDNPINLIAQVQLDVFDEYIRSFREYAQSNGSKVIGNRLKNYTDYFNSYAASVATKLNQSNQSQAFVGGCSIDTIKEALEGTSILIEGLCSSGYDYLDDNYFVYATSEKEYIDAVYSKTGPTKKRCKKFFTPAKNAEEPILGSQGAPPGMTLSQLEDTQLKVWKKYERMEKKDPQLYETNLQISNLKSLVIKRMQNKGKDPSKAKPLAEIEQEISKKAEIMKCYIENVRLGSKTLTLCE